MRLLIKLITINTAALLVAAQLIPGLSVSGGAYSYLVGGFLLMIGFKVVRPIFQIITFPLQMITFGLFSIVILAVILFAVSSVYSSISVSGFSFNGYEISGFSVPSFYSPRVLSFIIISATIYVLNKIFEWVFVEK